MVAETLAHETKERMMHARFTLGSRQLEMLRRYGPQIGLPLAVALLIVVFAANSEVFLTAQNFRNVGLQAAALAAVSFGQTFVILTAGLDLSVGSTVALVSVVSGLGIVELGTPVGLALGVLAGSKIKIVAEQTSQQDAATALSLASDFLQRFPKVNLLYGADDTYGVGAARAVQQAGRCGKTKVLMAVLGEAAAELMKAGCADYVVAQKTVLIGRTAVRLADALAHGKKPSPSLIEIPTIAVTPANIDTIDLSVIRQPKGWTP